MEDRIRTIIADALKARGAPNVSFAVEWPGDLRHGDYAVNAALAAAKELNVNPRTLAEDLAAILKDALKDDATSVDVAGPGFINVTSSRTYLAQTLADIDEDWGKGSSRAGERVVVEYSCPNPFKEMHIGHLMSTVIGESFSRLVENTGAHVIRDSYGGDVGPHVAKGIWGLRKKGITEPATAKEVGSAYEAGGRAYEESEVAKAEIDELNVALYTALAKDESEHTEEDRALLELWRKGRDAAFSAFKEIYRVLNSDFDYFIFESETTPIGMEVVGDALEKGIFTRSEGAVVYQGEAKGLHTLVFITSRGTPTYETKEIGLAFLKEQRIPNDHSYILTGLEQVGHFKVFLAAIEEIAPLIAQKTHHVPHGLLQLTTGKMSSRKGNVLTAAGIIEEVMEKALGKNDDPLVAEKVAVGALKYMILRASPGTNVVFDPEKSLSLDGDSGPYLQYALVRAKSILAQSSVRPSIQNAPDEPYTIERLIARFPKVAERAEAEKAPQHIATYLTQLAGEWNAFYAKERIRDGEYEAYKLMVAQGFVRTMERGLWLLGIPAPERM
ncbi:MAG TPA: arginine--tRNA ligase [Candidatus Paceibacterota bacterium]|nr:arginine--tRNA ligase [Candidatus Paceibacterota bacterium]